MAQARSPDFRWFALKPRERTGRELVSAILGPGRSQFEFSAQQMSLRGNGHIAHFGSHESANDFVFPSHLSPPDEGSFSTTPHGDLLLRDSSQGTAIVKLWATSKGRELWEDFTIRAKGGQCVIPMTDEICFTVQLAMTLFDLVWLVPLTADSVERHRARVCSFHRQHRMHLLRQVPPPAPAILRVEGKTVLTPSVALARGDILMKEIFKYKKIGSGGFGEVHMAIDIHTGRQVAIKEISQALLKRRGLSIHPTMNIFKKEVEKWAQLRHTNVAKLIHHQGWQLEPGRPVQLFMKLYEGDCTSIAPQPSCHQRFSTAKTRDLPNFLIHCLAALSHLHKEGLVHRDIKLQNILYKTSRKTLTKKFYLADFGLVAPADERTSLGGDMRYLAPEYLMNARARPLPPADIYCFGIAILEFLGVTNSAEFLMPEAHWLQKLALNGYRGQYHDIMVPRLGHCGHGRIVSLRGQGRLNNPVLDRMLDMIPANRPTAEEALKAFASHYGFEIPDGIEY